MQKRGQVTIFVILGLFIIIVLGFILYFQGYLTKFSLEKEAQEAISIPPSLKVISDAIQDCLDDTSYDAIKYVGAHGGYYNVPKESSIVYFTENIPYYYLENRKLVPSLAQIQNEIANYVKDNLKLCLNIEFFREQGFTIVESNYSVYSNIINKSVLVRLNYPIRIKKGGVEANLNRFDTKISSNLKEIHLIANKLIEIYNTKPGYVCLTCLDELTQNKAIGIEAVPVIDVTVFENNIIWFLIEDKEFNLKDKVFKLVFIVES